MLKIISSNPLFISLIHRAVAAILGTQNKFEPYKSHGQFQRIQ